MNWIKQFHDLGIDWAGSQEEKQIIQDFIQQLLDQRDEEIIGKLEGLKKKNYFVGYPYYQCYRSSGHEYKNGICVVCYTPSIEKVMEISEYNKAINHAISTIKENKYD